MKTLVLGGGPDREREVSIQSAAAIAEALQSLGHFEVENRTIDRVSLEELRESDADVVIPALHGPWGEGGPLQDILLELGRPFVGSGPQAARLAMDKIAAKAIATSIGAPTTPTAIVRTDDQRCPLALPVVAKPVHEGSTLGLHVCRTAEEWTAALKAIRKDKRPYMVEPYIQGREVTVSILDNMPLPVIEIVCASGLYDFDAKYERDDTQLLVNPPLPALAQQRLAHDALSIARALGVRHVARADFILDMTGVPRFLEINTMPGFTSHSLVPCAASAIPGPGLSMPNLCMRLIELALRDAPARASENHAQWRENHPQNVNPAFA